MLKWIKQLFCKHYYIEVDEGISYCAKCCKARIGADDE